MFKFQKLMKFQYIQYIMWLLISYQNIFDLPVALVFQNLFKKNYNVWGPSG